MKITDGLLGEHAIFYQLFDALDDVLDRATSSGEIQRAFDAVTPAILSHAELEDEQLFSQIGRGEAGIIAVMRSEHREIETVARGLSRTTTLAQTQSDARRLLDMLRDHFRREEEVLFPLCETALDASELEAFGERYKRERGLP
jgi:hemerythrin-like domain-containing protein